eukprot:COSAG06_NODE_43065_length_375_cov_1.304348_1_plen_23_part_10
MSKAFPLVRSVNSSVDQMRLLKS